MLVKFGVFFLNAQYITPIFTNYQLTLGNLVKIILKITENHWNSQFSEILEKTISLESIRITERN